MLAPLLVAGAVLAGCDADPDGDAHVRTSSNDCRANTGVTPKVGGPLQEDGGHVFRRDLVHQPPSVSMDVGVDPLINASDEAVVIDRVQLEPEPGVAPLVLKGVYVVSDASSMQSAFAGKYPAPLAAAACYHVEPSVDPQDDPYLVLRIATGSAKGASQNRSIDVFYHTMDGTPWIAVSLEQVRFDAPGA